MTVAEAVARAFHEAYERLAPEYGYETRKASAKPWAEVPEDNRRLMVAVAEELLAEDRIRAGGRLVSMGLAAREEALRRGREAG